MTEFASYVAQLVRLTAQQKYAEIALDAQCNAMSKLIELPPLSHEEIKSKLKIEKGITALPTIDLNAKLIFQQLN